MMRTGSWSSSRTVGKKAISPAAHVIPKNTGSYFIIVEIEKSPEERTHWALVYGFR